MGIRRGLIGVLSLFACGWMPCAVEAQQQAEVPCRDRPCAVIVDWTRSGGVAGQMPDRRYGNPAQLEQLMKAQLSERGYVMHTNTGDNDPRFLLIPTVRAAQCDEVAGTATDTSCRAISQLEVRVEGPEPLVAAIELPSRVRNRCPDQQPMPVDKLAAFLTDWIIYAVEGKAKGERRPVARC